MRKDGTFIAVEVDDAVASDAALARRLAEACPVDIFALRDGGALELVEGNLDECVLCRLCLDAVEHGERTSAGSAPPTGSGTAGSGAVRIIKLYDDGALLA